MLPSRKLLKLPRPKNEVLLIWFDLHFRLLGDLHFRQVFWSQFGEGFVFFQDIRSRLIAIFCTRPCSLIPRAVCWFRVSQNLASCEVNWYRFLELKTTVQFLFSTFWTWIINLKCSCNSERGAIPLCYYFTFESSLSVQILRIPFVVSEYLKSLANALLAAKTISCKT